MFGVSKEEQDRTANMLNYQVGTLPMTYHKTVGVKGFERILEKMRNKLQPWKGKNLSSGGRLILTNSSLSSIPTYRMFSLFETNHQWMDSIRSKFFWRGDVEKFKYHIVKWVLAKRF